MSMTKAELMTECARLRKRVALLERAGKRRTDGSGLSRRLRTELAEAREQQTATSEVLKVISRSPTDLQPVFDTILTGALRLCEAQLGHVMLYDGEAFSTAASVGATAEYAAFLHRGPLRPRPEIGLGRLLLERKPFQIGDLTETRAYRERVPITVAAVELAGARTVAFVPMVRDEEVVGAIIVYRPEVRLFTGRQIELVQTFAA
jgi:GAF domain-containing protein